MASKQTMRIDKVLSHMGIGSRSEIRKLAKSGKIMVNGVVVKDSSKHISPKQDAIQVEGKNINYVQNVYFMMNKPAGVISATEDRSQQTVLDLLDASDAHFAPFPIGRLDKDTTGLLLLSNDGQLAHDLLSPRKHVNKGYEVVIDGAVGQAEVDLMRQGVTLDDGYVTLPAELIILSSEEDRSKVHLTIQEGKFHQVKRMFRAVGRHVISLKRIHMGGLSLDASLSPGAYRPLTAQELAVLQDRGDKKST